MSFSNPEVFWSLTALVPAGWWLYVAYGRSRLDLARVAGTWRGQRLQAVYLMKAFFSGLLLLATFALLITAWAGPTWGHSPVEAPQDGLDVALTVDVSRSMTATDVQPSRLGLAKEAIRGLLAAFPGARFSLIAVEGTGVTLAPLSPDKTVLVRWIDELGPSVTTAPGTNLAAGVEEALRSLGFSSQHHRVIVLFSDGEARDGDVLAAGRRAAALGVEVFALAYGSLEGATIPTPDGPLRDEFGFTVQTRRNDAALQVLASESGGRLFVGSERASQREVLDQLSTLGNPASRGGVSLETVPRYRVFLFLALITLTGFLLVRIVPWKGSF